MQLTKQDIVSIIGVIKANFTYAYKDSTNEAMKMLINTWFESLKEFPKEVVGQACKLTLETSKMPPSLADIREQIKKIYEIVQPSVCDLWAEFYKAYQRVSYLSTMFKNTFIEGNGKTQGANAREKVNTIFSNLSPEIQNYISSASMLIVFASKSDDEMNYEKARFFNLIPSIQERLRLKNKITIDKNLLTIGQVKTLPEDNTLSNHSHTQLKLEP